MRLTSALFLFCFLTACAAPKSSTAPEQSKPTVEYKAANEIPVEEFFRNPAIVGYRISPDGSKMAVFKVWKSRLNVFVHKTGSPRNAKQVTFSEDRDLASFMWKGNNHILYSKDAGGDENFHVYSVNVDTGENKELTPFAGTRAGIVEDLEDVSPTDILIQHNQRDKKYFDLYRINIVTGESKLLAENTQKITSWLIDHEGNPRGGTSDDGVSSIFYFQKEKDKPFVEIFKTDFRNQYAPVAFTADNRNLFVATNLGSDLTKIVEVDPSEPTKFIRTVYTPAKYDVGGAEYSRARKSLGRINMTTDRPVTIFLHPDDQKDWEALAARFPGNSLALNNHSRDERFWVLKTISDHARGNYFLYDRKSKELTDLGSLSPWLPENLMSDMKTVHYRTRDGLEIEGYLTVPRGKDPKKIPIIIHPHGGPWARDEWRFSPDVQFLASRGYAVLQMNYRGSVGYGRKFWESSFKQWGKKMQDDITDGVKWLIAEGIADPKKVCIYGGSYGGYATLAGITFTPELYRCGVDYVGISNLFTFMKTIPPYWQPYLEMMHVMVGHPVKDKALLRSASPVFHADKVRAALFIAQGANDPRVNKNESEQMVEAMRSRGVVVEYMVKNNEGHGFRNEENRFDFYRAMEKFLAKHLGGRK